MRQHEIRDILRTEPFQPFQIRLSNGEKYNIPHPELAALTRHSLVVVIPQRNGKDADRVVQCDLVHIVSTEPVNGRSKSKNAKSRKK